ncbi:cilia- and flagella-associated protein 36-like isoform X1 [Anneissia japonica]|uniref:cilia- and flagella-associated protein 36-like isoform X1 n=1 Tax=Anneissia japonica TaxID=1529436 RepID=UPI001425513A|nr:cilia- and flagella-associated protein 36-like isoform X1 [Anneissia japonica]
MASEDWIPDTIVGFLNSPVWTVPIMTFIEEKCLVFDPSEENKLEYTEIHNRYKELVEYLLESFIEDLQIDAASFVEACKNAQDPGTSEANLPLFEQVMAAQSFPVFKTLMVQKNIELELQALRLIQKCNGVIPAALCPDQDTSADLHQARIFDDDEELMRKIMKQSEDEYKQQQASKAGAIDSTLENVLATSKAEAERLQKEKKKEEDIMKKVTEESKVQELLRQRTFEHIEQMDLLAVEKVLQMSLDDDEMKAAKATVASQSSLDGLPKISPSEQKKSSSDLKKKKSPSHKSPPAPSKGTSSQKVAAPSTSSKAQASTGKAPPSSKSGSDAAASWLDSARAEAAAASSTKSECTSTTPASEAAELKKREEYLKQQRDRLMAMKKKEREKSLNDFSKKEESKTRPNSSMAAKNATSGEVQVKSSDEAAENKKMKMRMALAQRLKKEVIQK